MKKIFSKKIWISILITAGTLFLAYEVSSFLLPRTGMENNSALVFVLAVAVISLATTGYVYGIVASLISAFCLNYFFMFPFSELNLTISGYSFAMLSYLSIALIVCTLVSRSKKHAMLAKQGEQKAMELLEKNRELEEERSLARVRRVEAETRSNILMGVSHDLRTPLTAISGAAGVILEQGAEGCSEENLKLISDIRDDAEWLSAMIENILLVTKLRDNKEPLKMRSEIIDDIIESCLIKIKKRFPDRPVEVRLPDDVVQVNSDPILLQQVFINLINNSITHSDSKSPVMVEITKEGGLVRCCVRDNGVGLPAGVLEQINNRELVNIERRADTTRGIGIGISVCQSILKAHNTELEAKSLENEGTEMYFYLPSDTEE